MNFLHNLDYLLHINKMSRAELARTIGIAPSTINAWYTKDYKGITLKNLVKLSNCFEITIEDLVNGDITSSLDFLKYIATVLLIVSAPLYVIRKVLNRSEL